MVTHFRITLGIGPNGLPGGSNNLDVHIHFADGTTTKGRLDVNQGLAWAAGSSHKVEMWLNRPKLASEITKISLKYDVAGPPWDLSFLRARAFGSFGTSAGELIAAWGSETPGTAFRAFSTPSPGFGIPAGIPASDACSSNFRYRVMRPVVGPVRVAPGAPVERRQLLMNGTQQTLLGTQTSATGARTTTLNNGSSRSTLPAVQRPAVTAPAMMQKTSSVTVGSSQPISVTGKNPGFSAVTPASGSNTGSGGTGLMSLKPLIPRGSSSGGDSFYLFCADARALAHDFEF